MFNSILKKDVLDIYIKTFLNNYKNIITKYYNGKDLQRKIMKMSNFIDKIAVWYEFKYPDNQINNVILDLLTLDKNKYLYTSDDLLNVLSFEEKSYLIEPSYDNIAYLDSSFNSYLCLDRDGFIINTIGLDIYTKNNCSDIKVIGMRLSEFLNLMKLRNIVIPCENELYEEIEYVKVHKIIKENILESIIYMIMKRNKNFYSAKRAYIFAKEFNLNSEIPLKYGLYLYDPHLNEFINLYLKDGGNENLKCYVDYFKSTKILTINDLKNNLNNKVLTYHNNK